MQTKIKIDGYGTFEISDDKIPELLNWLSANQGISIKPKYDFVDINYYRSIQKIFYGPLEETFTTPYLSSNEAFLWFKGKESLRVNANNKQRNVCLISTTPFSASVTVDEEGITSDFCDIKIDSMSFVLIQGSIKEGITVVDVDEAETKCVIEYQGKTYEIDKGTSTTMPDNNIVEILDVKAYHGGDKLRLFHLWDIGLTKNYQDLKLRIYSNGLKVSW